MRRTILLLGLGLAVLLSGCGMFEKTTPKPCPKVLALRDASSITQFREGPGRDLVDVAWDGEIANLASACKYLGNQVTTDVIVDLIVTRGPAGNESSSTSVSFFVAIMRSTDGAIVAKEVFDSRIAVKDGLRRGGVREEMRQVIQLEEGEEGDAYEVVVGFQLTDEQLAYNRRQR